MHKIDLIIKQTRTTEAQLSKVTLQKDLKTWKCAMKPSKMTSLLNSRWQNLNERPNRSANNGDMAECENESVTFM